MSVERFFEDLSLFFDAGGVVLAVLFCLSLFFWMLVFERIIYFQTLYKIESNRVFLKMKEEGSESWSVKQNNKAQISTLYLELQKNLSTIKVIIALFPLLGLLGTITGMISVFDSMSLLGTNAKAMASGISMATIPTMAGMMLAVLGLFVYSRVKYIVSREVLLFDEKTRGFYDAKE